MIDSARAPAVMHESLCRFAPCLADDASAGPFDDDCIARIDCTDVDELTEQIRDWTAEFSQLSPGAFAASGLMVPLGSMLVGAATFSGSLLQRGTPPVGCLSIVLPGRGCDRFVCCGRDLMEGQCMVLGAGANAEAVSRGTSVVVAVSVGNDAWQSASDWVAECSVALGRRVLRRTPGIDWTESVLDGVAWILDAFVKYPQRAKSRAASASMSDLMLVRLHDLADTAAQPRNSRREHNRRRIAVARARSFIHENLTSPIRLSELCTHAHAQARSLEYGFQEIVGMSPVSYIRTLRLNRVHRLLRSKDTAERTITEIALDCGFWHLSQFAVDYRRFFGESPSAVQRPAPDTRLSRSHATQPQSVLC